jgi:hypothetical protein
MSFIPRAQTYPVTEETTFKNKEVERDILKVSSGILIHQNVSKSALDSVIQAAGCVASYGQKSEPSFYSVIVSDRGFTPSSLKINPRSKLIFKIDAKS